MKATIVQDFGSNVHCDDCNKQWTDDMKQPGGIYFSSYAICPECAPRWIAGAKLHDEEQYIRARQPDEKTFWRWVMEDLRQGNNYVVFYTE